MNVKTKYKIGEEVYVIQKNGTEVLISTDSIEEISITKRALGYQVKYFLESNGEDYDEDELLSIEDKNILIYRIDKSLGI